MPKLPSLALVLIVAALSLFAGCPETSNPDGGSSVGDGDGDGDTSGGDGDGDGNGGTIDVGCTNDGQCGAGLVCDTTSGSCVAGFDCSQNPSICAFCGEPGQDCGTGTAPVYCDEAAGVCRRSKATCDACAEDAECGSSSDFPGKCIGGYCAEGCALGTCPAGFACEGGGCVAVDGALPDGAADACDVMSCQDGEACPDGQRCSDLGLCLALCNDDTECPLGKICQLDPGPSQGTCINGCVARTTTTSNGTDLICHANGRYAPLCTTPGGVGTPAGCPAGFECDDDGFCDSPGCQSSADCPLVRTYCDVGTGECVDGCEQDSDCAAFELCDDGACKAQGCRGKDVSCNLGQWCCGEELFDDATTCPSGVADGQCFLAPDPWCRTCEDDNGCADIDAFGQGSHCYELQQQDEDGNTVSLGKFCSVGCETNLDCPRGLTCEELPDGQEGGTIRGCISSLCPAIADARGQ